MKTHPKTSRFAAGLIAIGFASFANVHAQTIYIDFGNSAGVASTASGWNAVTGASGTDVTYSNLVNSTGAATSVSMLVAGGSFTNAGAGVAGGTTGFTSTASGFTHTFITAATNDYLASSNASGTLTFSNLDPAKTYTFEVFASRSGGVSDKRAATYTLSNGGLTSNLAFNLEANNNVSLTSFGASFAPSALGVISLTITKQAGNNTAGFFYIDALAVSASAIPEPSSYAGVAGVGALGLGLLRRRRK